MPVDKDSVEIVNNCLIKATYHAKNLRGKKMLIHLTDAYYNSLVQGVRANISPLYYSEILNIYLNELNDIVKRPINIKERKAICDCVNDFGINLRELKENIDLLNDSL